MRKFCVSLLLVLVLLVPTPALAAKTVTSDTAPVSDWLVPRAREYDGRFRDAGTAWCASAITTVYDAGLMEGYTASAFGPGSVLTNAQIVAVSARLLNLLGGGNGIIPVIQDDYPWYQSYYDYLTDMGVVIPGSLSNIWSDDVQNNPAAAQNCERQTFVQLLSAVLDDAGIVLPALNTVQVLPDSLDASVLGFYDAGILNGMDRYGTFRTAASLNRGQAAAMLARLVDPAERLTFTLPSFDLCADVFRTAPSAVLLTIGGRQITMEQAARTLACSLLDTEAGEKVTPQAALEGAVSDLKTEVAVQLLAEKNGLTWTDADVTSIADVLDEETGYMGITRNGWIWSSRQEMLSAGLTGLYWSSHSNSDVRDSDFYETVLTRDLNDLAAKLTVTRTAALQDLDLSACRTRLNASPFSYVVF